MVSVTEAKQIILEHTKLLDSVLTPIDKTLGHTLAIDINSPIDLPPFPQSSMDGYAFSFSSLSAYNELSIKHKIAAGDNTSYSVGEGEAVRIFTGAPVPPGADTIVMQERVEVNGDKLRILDTNLVLNSNYRHQGHEIKQNELALKKGVIINAAAIGFLASMGIKEVPVIRKPRVSILITGNELSTLDQKLSYGKVYDSNSYTLIAALHELEILDINPTYVKDDMTALVNALKDALETSDLILLTGGVSVGDFDIVTKAANEIGIQTIFHKIKQKPGKPMYFGIQSNKYIFGLPGNPASALTCFYEYVTLAIEAMTAGTHKIKEISATISQSYKKPSGLTHFLKAFYMDGTVTPLDAQESFRLKSFAIANALIVIPEDTTEVKAGEEVIVHLLYLF